MLKNILNWTSVLAVAAVVCLSYTQTLSADKGKGGHKGGHKGGGHHHSGGHHHGGGHHRHGGHHHHHHHHDNWNGGWYAPRYSNSWNTGIGSYNSYWGNPSSFYYNSYDPYYYGAPYYQGSYYIQY